MSEDLPVLSTPKKVRAILAAAVCIVAALTGWVLYEYAIKSSATGPLVWPTVELTLSDSLNVTFAVTAVEYECEWDDVCMMLRDVESGESVSWDIPQDGLLSSTGIAVTSCLESQVLFQGTSVTCNMTDVSGNNRIDVGDHFTLSLTDSDSDDSPVLELRLIYKPMDESMESIEFQPGEEEPWPLNLSISLATAAAAMLAVVMAVVVIRQRRGKSGRLD